MYNDKNLIIWNSANSFKEDKNVKFSTWLANQVKYSCLNCLNKKSKDRLVTTEDKSLDALKEKVETAPDDDLFEFTENILSQLKDPRIKKIFSLRYSNLEKKPSCRSLSNIGKNHIFPLEKLKNSWKRSTP